MTAILCILAGNVAAAPTSDLPSLLNLRRYDPSRRELTAGVALDANGQKFVATPAGRPEWEISYFDFARRSVTRIADSNHSAIYDQRIALSASGDYIYAVRTFQDSWHNRIRCQLVRIFSQTGRIDILASRGDFLGNLVADGGHVYFFSIYIESRRAKLDCYRQASFEQKEQDW